MREDLLPTTFGGKVSRIVEEIGEVLQAVGKLQRFGKYARDPVTTIGYDNVRDLHEELLDLQHAITQLQDHKE